jgi:hypothetical protein
VRSDERQVNYVAARSAGKLCVALMNEAERPLKDVVIRLDPARFASSFDKKFRAVVWRDNVRQAEPIDVVNGAATVSLSPRGITALVIEGLDAKVAFQDELHAATPANVAARHVRFAAPVGEVQATVISFGPKLTWLYAYATADDKQIKSAVLYVEKADGPATLTDAEFPFEFSLPLDVGDGELKLSVEMTTTKDEKLQRQGGTL